MHRVVFEDGNGGQTAGYFAQMKISRAKAVLGLLAGTVTLLLAVGTVAFNATRAGVAVQTGEQIRAETNLDDGIINREIEHKILEHRRESEEKLSDDLSEIMQGITRIETKQEDVCRRLDRLEARVE
jgi:hypothetical protein